MKGENLRKEGLSKEVCLYVNIDSCWEIWQLSNCKRGREAVLLVTGGQLRIYFTAAQFRALHLSFHSEF